MRVLRQAMAVTVLVLVLGLHWALLQTAAWTRMVVDFSRSMPLGEAISQTFDGRHPCPLCLAIQQARQSEAKESPALSKVRLRWEFDLPATPPVRVERMPIDLPAGSVAGYGDRTEAPPKPRPRSVGIA